DNIAAPGCRGIRLAGERGAAHRLTTRVLGAVDEAQKVAVVEETKAVDLVDRRDRVAEARHDLPRHLEAKVHPLRTDMEQQVPWRRNRMARSGPDLPERVEFGRARVPEQPIPCLGPDPHHAGKAGFELTKFPRANQPRQVSAKHRTIARLSGPGFIVTTRKIAARVSGADTGCATAIASVSDRFSEWAFGALPIRLAGVMLL